MINKRLKIILISIASLFLIIPGVALSTFYFDTEKKESNIIDTNIMVDDIKENYKFGEKKLFEDKEYTIYFFPTTQHYKTYKEYLSGVSGAKLPETGGYITPKIDDVGKPVKDSSGNVIYEQVDKETDGFDVMNTITTSPTYIAQINTEYWDAYEKVYSSFYNGTGLSSDEINYGTPDEDVVGTFKNYLNSDIFSYRNMHRHNRFGYWRQFSKDEGRYLPIKLTIKNTLSPDLYSETIPTPFTDTGDYWFYYNFTFSNWTYVKKLSDGTYQYPFETTNTYKTETLPYSSYDINQYFNIMSSLEEYADENGVIRLFPTFSQGKGYDSSSLSRGGRDAIRINYTYADNITDDRYKYDKLKQRYFQYDVEELNDFYGFNKVKYASITNIDIDPTIYKSLSVTFHFAYGANSYTRPGWNHLSDYEMSIDLSSFPLNTNGTGLYNLYIFVANSGESSDLSTTGDYSKWADLNNLVTDGSSNSFQSLKDKDLIKVGREGKTDKASYISDPTGTGYFKGIKPTFLCLEKVNEFKVVNDINTSSPTLKDDISSKYNSATNFVNISENVYKGKYNEDGSYTYDDKPLNATNSHLYILRNVDFSSDTFNQFQIRISETGDKFFNFIANDDGKDLIFNPTDTRPGDQQIFVDFSKYANYPTSSSNYFSFKDSYQGVYDFILQLVESKTSNPTYKIYARRHGDVFIKLMKNDVSKNLDTSSDDYGFAIHTDASGGELDSLLWSKTFYIGEKLKSYDKDRYDETLTFEEAIKNYITVNYPTDDYKDYVIKDHVTKYVIARFDSTGTLQINTNFQVKKNYIFYLDKKI